MAIPVESVVFAHVDTVEQVAVAIVRLPSGRLVRRIVERTGRGLNLTAAQLRALLVALLQVALPTDPAHEPVQAALIAGAV